MGGSEGFESQNGMLWFSQTPHDSYDAKKCGECGGNQADERQERRWFFATPGARSGRRPLRLGSAFCDSKHWRRAERGAQAPGVGHAPARPRAAGGLASILFLCLFLNLYRCWASVRVNPEELPRRPRSFAPNFRLNPERLPCRARTRGELPRHPRTRRLELPRHPRTTHGDFPPRPRTSPICQAWRLGEHRSDRFMGRTSASTPNR